MSQVVFDTIVPTGTSGTQLASILESFKDAMMSGLSGDSRPDQLEAGGAWIDTSMEDAPNYLWSYKVWTGAVDITVFKINLATSALVLSASDSEFSVKRVSDDTVAAIVKLVKNRVSGTGSATANNDVLGELQFIGRTSAGADTIMGRIRTIATQATTNTGAGAALVFESTKTGETVASEAMRLVNGRLGVGTSAPLAEIHSRGPVGMRVERFADDNAPSRLKIKKSRVAGNGSNQNADVLAALDMVTADELGGEGIVSQILATATQAHSSTVKGAKLSLLTTKTGENALTEQMTIADVIEAIARIDINLLRLVSQDVATAASIAQLSATKAIVNMTGATPTSIQGINSGAGLTKVIVVHNGSTATVTLTHNDAAATAADRMKFANGDNVELLPNSSVELFYSVTDACWKIKSGSGSGGGAMRVTAIQTLAAGNSINTSTTDQRQMRHVQGTGGQTAISTLNPFGSGGGWKDGTELLLVGNSSANSVLLTYSDTSKGIVGNFDTWELGLYQTAMLVYSASLDRWILRGA
jgi:hypothetical protein